jgi:NADPH:quinone reductase
MKAVVITEPGTAEVLKVLERPKPSPSENEVLIRVEAAGLNGLDVLQRKGKYPVPVGAPADILGLEVAGVIEACGSNVTNWDVGDKVCALISGGGYAEYAVADAGSCLPIPENIDFVQAASLPETVFTVWHNVFQRGRLQEGENFLVHGGSSGIGVTAIQLAHAFGATVYATAGSDRKCSVCEELGSAKCINYTTSDFEEELKDIGIDVVLDMVGGEYMSKNINLLRPDGRLVFINAKSADLKGNVYAVMQKRLTITGSTLRARDLDFKAALASDILDFVWPLVIQERFKPVIDRVFPLDEAADAHRLMESSAHIGKIILTV